VFETLHMRRDGTTFPVEVSSQAAMIGTEPVLMSILRDLTERNAMQARLVHSDRMAAVGTLAAGVAHEINNPLAYAFTNLEVLERKLERISASWNDPPSSVVADLDVAKNALSIAREGANRVRAIVRDLKTFSRIDDVDRGPIDVRAVLDSCVNMAAAELRYRARLIRDYSEVPLVEASESRIAQVFLNLLVNAAQAVDPNRASHNEIRLIVSSPDPAAVVIEIIDNGPGIPEELRARIFDPFVTTKGEGTGLGLFISREIVVALGGSIEVNSALGRGTRMRVVLPAAAERLVSVPPARQSPAPNSPRIRVLVIDDEDSIGISLRRALEGEVTVVVTTSGLEALELLERDRTFDAIVCDVVMPEMDGVAVYDRVRALYPTLAERFLFMTGGALSTETRAFLSSMQSRVIEKPFSTDDLRDKLRRTRRTP
jgi:signal transduction histidine kinase/CheY-like chemotaxis protein